MENNSHLDEWRKTKDYKKLEVEWTKIVSASEIIEKNVTVHLIEPKSLRESIYNSKGKMND